MTADDQFAKSSLIAETGFEKKTCCTRRVKIGVIIGVSSFVVACGLVFVGLIAYYAGLQSYCDRQTYAPVTPASNPAAAAAQRSVDSASGLRINDIQAIGTHNSYHVANPVTLGYWKYTHPPLQTQLSDYGVRHVEIDVHSRSTVRHISMLDDRTTCACFESCLYSIRQWSAANPLHQPLFVFIEPTSWFDIAWRWSGPDVVNQIEKSVLKIFSDNSLMVRPDDVRGSYATLKAAVNAQGWPTLESSRGKVIFGLFDQGFLRDAYLQAYPGLRGATLFPEGNAAHPTDETAWIKLDDPRQNVEYIQWAVQQGYLIRTRADDVTDDGTALTDRFTAAVTSGAQFVSTDFEEFDANYNYQFRMPGGATTRCNPVTAPSSCQNVEIENLPASHGSSKSLPETETVQSVGAAEAAATAAPLSDATEAVPIISDVEATR